MAKEKAKVSAIGEAILNGLAPMLTLLATQQLVALFNKFAFNDKKAYEAFVVALYPSVDVHLEKLTGKSKSKIDDAIVSGLKGALEQSAAENDVKLPELDED